ncbi:ComF family protein [Acinetobacter rathckeae]|uniref:ComF family protein n=1 Tax=Acinetobacter rathckeae TaxID=2605272 RepID=UPI0018A32D7B|nr:phosphoribosyltransferase family protein [Acinetobacter rathckeae]MBF7686643.1 ComF family protein [Acinetobacter rathckeae]MBF7696460.1 ComF family protein [Acinetobacter rathckeae]
MLMFNLLLSKLSTLQPCVLCEHANAQNQRSVCNDCWQHLKVQPQHLNKQDISILTTAQYQYPINKIIQKFKYNHQLQYLRLFSDLLDQIKIPNVQAIVAMPISTARLHERGFNQAHLLAKIIAKKYRLPIWAPIERIKEHSQKGQSRSERLTNNIQQQFKIKDKQRIKYRHVLIIDDVVTTGSSIQALKLKLEQIGCKHIHVICIAAVA